MKRVNKIISLILVLTIICSMFCGASAAGEDIVLTAFKEDGSSLGADDVIAVGDKITVKMSISKSANAFSASFRIWFDKSVFDFESGSFSDTVKSAYSADQTIVNPTTVNKPTDEEQAKLNNGLLPINLDVSAPGSHDVDMPTGEWASLVFVAINAAEGSLFQTQIRAIDSEEAMDDISDQFTAGTLSVTVEESTIAVTGVLLDQSTLTLTAGGATATLTATVTPGNATDKTVTWNSDNEAVATVADGVVTPLTAGSAIITASAGEFSATCAVTVEASENVPVTSVAIYNSDGTEEVTEETLSTKKVGSLVKTLTLTARVNPENATNPQITWSSSDPSVVTVSEAGVLTAVSAGTAVITAEAEGVTATCAVTVIIPVNSISVEPKTFKGRIGNTVQLTATVKQADATIKTVSWSSDDENIATVDSNGLVTIVGTGSVVIKATAMDGSEKFNKCTVTVFEGPNGGYMVTLPEEEKVSAVEEFVSIPISVQYEGEENYTTFNTVDMMVRFDASVLEYVSDPSITGEIRYIDYGADKQLNDNAIILQFKVKTLEETTVSVDYARIDYYEHAVTDDIANAAVINGSTLIKIAVFHGVTLADGLRSEQGNSVRDGEAYTFEIVNYDPNYDYTFDAKMGGEAVAVTDNEDGTYTIESVTADVEISNLVKTGKVLSVTIEGEDVTGPDTANYGSDYTFTVTKETGYDYDITVTVNGGPVTYTGPDDDGNYTIAGANVTGPIAISVVKTEIPPTVYTVTFTGNGKNDVIDPAPTVTEGADYTFELYKQDGYEYTVKYLVEGASEIILQPNANGSYTVPGENINADILITVERVRVYTVTFVGNAADRVAYPVYTAQEGETYRFGVAQWYAYTYTVSVTMGGGTPTELTSPTPEGANSQTILYYDVPDVQGDLTIEINSEVTEDKVYVLIENYVETDGGTFYLIGAALRNPKSNQQFLSQYDGNNMFRGNKYLDLFASRMNITDSTVISRLAPYVYLIYVSKGEAEPKVEDIINKFTYDNKSAGNLNVETYDINGSGFIDVNDAQLVYDIYNGRYDSFEVVSMRKFLDADTNCDFKVNVADTAVVVDHIV